MSRLWADRLYVALAPEAVAAARVSGLVRARVVWNTTVQCDAHFGAEPWHGAVDALGRLIAPLRERARATVVLSNRFVRYAVVPFDPQASAPEEELALARYHFTRIHGDKAKGWEVRLAEAPHGAPRLASAIDPGLAGAVRAAFAGSGARLVSIQPYLMAAFNRSRRALAREGAWLALVEGGRACLALATREGWRHVQSVRMEGETIAQVLEREALRLGAPAPRRVVALEEDACAMALAAR